ncbi:hypothetical protein ACP275_10G023900 [Erythranthe tilingii]
MVRKRKNLPKKCSTKGYTLGDDEDRISELPDDILVVILSLLSVKEAASTSILCSRWINLWKHTNSLDFDGDAALYKTARLKKELQFNEMRKYVRWVDSIIQSHKSHTIQKLRIQFFLTKKDADTLTKWFEYAFSRQVPSLEIDLSPPNFIYFGNPNLNYVFPQEFTTSATCFDLKHLKALSLKFVTVTREAIEFFLNNCPFLEKFIVHHTKSMSKLEICGSSLALKHLELCYFFGLDSVRISAPNLTSLTIRVFSELILENVPMLDELRVGCGYSDFSVKKLLPAYSAYISQLKSLTLFLNNLKGSTDLCKFPEMPKLKKLVIAYCSVGEDSLLPLTSLIRASTRLQEFVLKLDWYQLSRSDREIETSVRFPHEYLKVVKFFGYYGRSSDYEFVRYFIDNCVVLERLIIDPHCVPYAPHDPITPTKLAKEVTAMECTKRQLESQVPAHIELVIIP